MLDVISLDKTGSDTADITISVFRIGNFITAGKTELITIHIQDNDNLRSISTHLNHMKENNFPGLVKISFNDKQKYQMDQSVWRELADALFAFTLCVDCANIGI